MRSYGHRQKNSLRRSCIFQRQRARLLAADIAEAILERQGGDHQHLARFLQHVRVSNSCAMSLARRPVAVLETP